MNAKTKKQQLPDFEANLAELNKLVVDMERSPLSLENMLENFSRGMTLSKQCQQILQTAEQKVETLTKDTEE